MFLFTDSFDRTAKIKANEASDEDEREHLLNQLTSM